MIHLIVKPQIKRNQKKLMKKICARLNETGVEYELHETLAHGDGSRIARMLTEGGEDVTIVGVGGDGTLNDILNGIVYPSHCTLGLIPAGTGNDFAAAANIPKGIKALDLILNSEPKYTDFLDCGSRRSMNIAGIGLDVDILIRCERMKHFHNKTKYFISLLSSLIKYRGDKMFITVNGETSEHNAMIAAVCNGKQLGGGIPLCPPADIEDGKINLVVVEYPKRSKILGALIKLMRGKVLTLPFVKHYLCEEAILRPAVPCQAQYDGELYETEALDTKIIHEQLKMFRG